MESRDFAAIELQPNNREMALFCLLMNPPNVAEKLGIGLEAMCRKLSAFRRKASILTPNRHEIVLDEIESLRAAVMGATKCGLVKWQRIAGEFEHCQ